MSPSNSHAFPVSNFQIMYNFFLVGGIGFDSVIMSTDCAEIFPFQNVATCMWSHLGICINFSCQVRVEGWSAA